MEPLRTDPVPSPAVRRLSLYLRQLETYLQSGKLTVSSRQLGEALGFTDAQVRKDFAHFGQFGHPGLGYKVAELVPRLKSILGTDRTWPVLLVGAGNLGRALLSYRGFASKGFQLIAAFDDDADKVGSAFGDLVVRPMVELEDVAKQMQVKLALLAVPGPVAQPICDRLVTAGVRGILNFAPVRLNVPDDVTVGGVDLAVQLEQLSFQVRLGPASDPPPGD